jgi:hypothetical protein
LLAAPADNAEDVVRCIWALALSPLLRGNFGGNFPRAIAIRNIPTTIAPTHDLLITHG